jgi:hypothetical protein
VILFYAAEFATAWAFHEQAVAFGGFFRLELLRAHNLKH